ncbi:MAG: hypothetical protein NT105_10960 [Verrucomicrobia bacterium]|nr:hypothetical protein [Verrucomicrobiota bacterium]
MKQTTRWYERRWVEIVLVLGIIVGASFFAFWRVDSFSGGLHWENYDHAFCAGLVDSGRVSAQDMWRTIGKGYASTVVQCAVLSVLNMGWGASGIVFLNCLVAVWTVTFTYILARLCFGRMAGIAAATLLLGCPAFITHTFCGYYAALLNAAAAVPCVLLFVLAHRTRNPLYLLGASYLLSWSYLFAYVSFPVLMLAIIFALLVASAFQRRVLLGVRWYLAAMTVLVVSILANGALVSVYYCGQDPLFVVRSIESQSTGILGPIWQLLDSGNSASQAGGPTKLQPQQVLANVLNMIVETFVGASPAYKTFVPSIPAAVWPFDHLGANLPGTPALCFPMTILLIAGVIGTLVVRRFDLMVVALVWSVLLLIVSLALSFHTRRLVIVAPFMATTAAFGLSWLVTLLFRNWPHTRQSLIVLLPMAVLAYAAHDIKSRFSQHLRTLQYDCNAEVGQFISQNLDATKDVLVLLDKSVMFPSALYCETGFRPYRFAVMSEFYFPVLLASGDGNLVPLQETYSCELHHMGHMLRYCNMQFPSVPFDLRPDARDAAWQQFHALLLSENQKGHQLYLLASLAEEKSLEAGSQYLYQFLLTELERRKVGLQPVAEFGRQPTGHPHAIVFKLSLPAG